MLKIKPNSIPNIIELAVLAAVGAGLTVVLANVANLNLGVWSAVVSSVITIALSIITSLENS